MKKVLSILLVMMIAVSLFANGASEASGAKKTIQFKLGTIWSDADPSTAAVNKFAELVEEKSNGEMKVSCFNNSQLGGVTDMLTGMPAGTIEMVHTRISTYGFLSGASMFNICAAPFIWDDNAELEAFLKTDVAQEWFDAAAKATGVRVFLAKGETEARQLSSNKAVRNADDFKGLKIRTADSVVVQSTMKALGAIPTVVQFSDLYMALRQGTVDAQENGFITDKNNSLYEVQKYLMRTDYIRDISIFCIAENVWQTLTDEQKQILIACAEEAADVGTELTNAEIESAFEFLKTKMEYVEIDIKSIQDKLGNVYEDLDGVCWDKGAWAAVKAFKESR